ncbi:hypothetical protein [Streptomyces graminilatus]|uniref:hypothetical protein n=1 Tax=Streptomyces graminilatus TaxID=1464070 RepID=UPI0006E31920|nr:hypothetical protein [Streptomyces graminilatus]
MFRFRTVRAGRPLAVGAATALMSLGAVAASAPTVRALPGAPISSATPSATSPVTPSPGAPQSCCQTELTVTGPAAPGLGLAGGPVGFTERITNTSATESEDVLLNLVADAGEGMPENGLAIWYLTDDRAWQTVTLAYNNGSFQGALPSTITLGPGESRLLHLRIGLPMGEPHNGDSDGGTEAVKLTSSVGAADGSWVLEGRDVRTIAVRGLSAGLAGVPMTAVPGGAPVEFRATLANPTASDYVNVNSVLFTDRYAAVSVYREGHWVPLKPVVTSDAPDTPGFYLRGHDHTAPAGSSTVRVRVAWKAGAPFGMTSLTQSVIVNEGSVPFEGTAVGTETAQLALAQSQSAAPSPSASPAPATTAPGSGTAGGASPNTPAPTATSTPAPAASTPSVVSQENTGTLLAGTGNNEGPAIVLTLGGTALVLGGGSLAAYTRVRYRP